MKPKTVAIIGAGACGLVCAKVISDDGFDVTLFERQRELGGIWSAESAYANLHTQQPGGTFEFSDLYNGKGIVHLCYLSIIIVYFHLRICSLANCSQLFTKIC
jgi:NADPH-dependent 2,4-dienoyl-CoA reductase/sulfur reductase-like enzyme